MSKRYRSERIRPRGQPSLAFKQLSGTDIHDPDHFRKIWACEAMAVDAEWRNDRAYGEKTTETYLREMGADDAEQRHDDAAYYQLASQSGDKIYFVCYDGKRLAGLCCFTDWRKDSEPENQALGPQISELYVLPGYQRLGIAAQLLAHAECWVRDQGVDRLYLEATPTAEQFYLRRGYIDAEPADPHLDGTGSTVMGRLMYNSLQQDYYLPSPSPATGRQR